MQGPTLKGIPTFLYHLALSGVTSVTINNKGVDNVFIFSCFMIFMDDDETYCFHAYVGDARPRGSSQMDRRAEDRFVHRGDDELTDLEENLGWLTLDILDVAIDDLPQRFHRHITGLSGSFNHLLHGVSRAIMC